MIDREAFEERAAIIEFDGGLSRFRAETLAAEAQGLTRWQAMEEIRNADRVGNPSRGGDHRQAVDGQQRQNAMPRVQPRQAEEDRPMPERDAQAGRDRLELLALRQQRREAV